MKSDYSALALAAGGARGAYQAGALRFLAEAGVHFDAVAGTSIGALNAAFYTQGSGTTEDIEKLLALWRSLPDVEIIRLNAAALGELLPLLMPNPLDVPATILLERLVGEHLSLLDPSPLSILLDQYIDYERVCKSHIRFFIAALEEINSIADIMTSPWRSATYFEASQLEPPELKRALLAATAIPIAFSSQEVGGRRYADAALVDALPAFKLYEVGARRIFSIFLSDTNVQNRADFEQALLFQIRPSININESFFSTFDFTAERINKLIDLGYSDAQNQFTDAKNRFDKLITMQRQGEQLEQQANQLPQRGTGSFLRRK